MLFQITPAAGKRLIARALVRHSRVEEVLNRGMLVIIAGTTNGYLAEEILKKIGENDFQRDNFYRGLVIPPNQSLDSRGRLEFTKFPGDVIIQDGEWITGGTIYDVAEDLAEGDLIFKGANAINYPTKQAAVLIGHPQGGTILTTLPGVVGRRVELIIPVGLEKRVDCDLNQLAVHMNKPGLEGPRLLPVPGEIYTEIEAIKNLTGAEANLVAAGGVDGAEGSIWLHIQGDKRELKKTQLLLNDLQEEAPFQLSNNKF